MYPIKLLLFTAAVGQVTSQGTEVAWASKRLCYGMTNLIIFLGARDSHNSIHSLFRLNRGDARHRRLPGVILAKHTYSMRLVKTKIIMNILYASSCILIEHEQTNHFSQAQALPDWCSL